MSPCETERASLALKKIRHMQFQNGDFWPAEEVAAVMTACRQAALCCSLAYVTLLQTEVNFEKQS